MIVVLVALVLLNESLQIYLQDTFASVIMTLLNQSLVLTFTTICLMFAAIPLGITKIAQLTSPKSSLSIAFACVFALGLEHFIGFSPVNGMAIKCTIACWLIAATRKMLTNSDSPKKKAASPVKYDADVIIVGCGTAGAALAYALGKQKRKVVVIEKNLAIQDRIVGELMQPGGLQALRMLGLEDCALGQEKKGTMIDSVPISGYCVISKDTGYDALLPYPAKFPESFAEGFGFLSQEDSKAQKNLHGRGFHNGLFVQRIREQLTTLPNVKVIEGTVSKLLEVDGYSTIQGVEYKCKVEGQEDKVIYTKHAPLTIVADGMWSALRQRVVQASQPEVISNFAGLILRNDKNCPAPIPHQNRGHVILAQPSPILMYQVSSTETRILVDIPGKVPRASTGELAKYFREFVAPQLPQVSQAAFLEAVNTTAPKIMPNRGLVCSQPKMNGVFLLGDAYNMRHPLTGGGMTVALKDVVLIASLLKPLDNFEDFESIEDIQKHFSEARKDHASTINILANALYHVFTSPPGNDVRSALRNACSDYLAKGGVYQAGPVGLLSAVTPNALILTLHFFMVALYAMYQILLPFPTFSKMYRAWKVLHIACIIIMPLIEKENATILSWTPFKQMINLIFPFRNQQLN